MTKRIQALYRALIEEEVARQKAQH
jgi:hypothetical protein